MWITKVCNDKFPGTQGNMFNLEVYTINNSLLNKLEQQNRRFFTNYHQTDLIYASKLLVTIDIANLLHMQMHTDTHMHM